MPYLNSTGRTASSTSNEKFQPLGRVPTLFGVFLGYVKRTDDVQKMGRLQVWIPEFGSAPDEESGWTTVSYCSPFAGATNVGTINKTDIADSDGTQSSYGFWMVPPDINNQVLIMFINGDSARGIWMGSLFNQFVNNMVPGVASSTNNYQYPGKEVPITEYNKNDTKATYPDSVTKPIDSTKFKGVGNQGLITDTIRGVTNSSARRESPSQVFGISTPGPVIDKNATPGNIRRKGGSSFVMDDSEGSEYVQLSTKSGAQININETTGFIYIINRDGTAWIQMDQSGNVDVFGAANISMRAQRDFNIRADRNINIEAGQNIFMKAAKDTREGVTEFTYDVNNIPRPTSIPVWNYMGEGLGDGGNIVMQSLNNWQSTTKNGAFLTVIDNNLNIKIGNSLNVTTQNGGQDFNSKQGIKLTTDAALDISTTGNIRVGSNGSISVVGIGGVSVCTDASISLNAASDIIAVAVGTVSIDASIMTVGTDVEVGNLTARTTNTGTITSSTVTFNGQPLDGNGSPGQTPNSMNTIPASGALSASTARPAEIKPLNEKLNILATWSDPTSKFKRNSQSVQTTVSVLPTYEPSPSHATFSPTHVSSSAPIMTADDSSYVGSAGVGNNASTAPLPSVNPGSNNSSIVQDPITNNFVTKDVNVAALRCQLVIHEGLKNRSYSDVHNLVAGGIGHLIRDNELSLFPLGTPISNERIETWYEQDTTSAIKIAQVIFGDAWSGFSDIRKRAVTDLAFNLGRAGLSKFVKFVAAMKNNDFGRAGQELRDSAWFGQVGKRGPNIVMMVVQDIDPNGCDRKFPG